MNKGLAMVLVFVLGVGAGAFGFHTYLDNNPEASRPYVASALLWAEEEADQEIARAYVRMVLTAIEVARVDSPSLRPPSDCSAGYSFGVDVPRNHRILSCSVHVDSGGKATVNATTLSGRTASFGPF